MNATENDIPPAPDYDETLHVFDCRDFDRTDSLIQVQPGETMQEAKQQIPDDEAEPPALRNATETDDGMYRNVDFEKDRFATLDDDYYPSLVYLGTPDEAVPHLLRMFAASDRDRRNWSFAYPHDFDSKPLLEWFQTLYEHANN